MTPGAASGAVATAAAMRYGAFISYSHADAAHARWLHRVLETYRIPKKLVGTETAIGRAPRRLPPMFRDRDELPASGDLGTELRAALAAAAFQVVLCSERAATSRWVNEEILAFKRVHGEHRTLALIVGGEPYSADRECFPPALRFKLGTDGQLSDAPAEPIAADIRPGGDGRRLASLKIIAGLTGLPLDALVQRDAARRQRRLAGIAGGAVAVAIVTLGLAVYANDQRIEAVRQRELADSSLDFLINTFKIANPATENPRTITAITILDRVSRRAGGAELKARPEVRARLLGATGDIYLNLGLGKEAERDLRAALALTPARGGARATLLLKLAGAAFKQKQYRAMGKLVDAAVAAYAPDDPQAALLNARVASARGLMAYAADDQSAAARYFQVAAKSYRSAPGDNVEDYGRALMNAGNALALSEHFAEADAAFMDAETVYRQAFGTDHLLTATAMQNRALGAFEAGRLAEAERSLAAAIVVYHRVLDADHPATAAALLLYGRIRHAREDYAGAVKAFDQAIAMDARLFGPLSPAVGDVAFYKAKAQADAGMPQRALATLLITKRSYDAAYGPVDREQVELANLKTDVLRVAGQLEDARLACEHGLIIQAKLDAHDPALSAARNRCANLAAGPARLVLH